MGCDGVKSWEGPVLLPWDGEFLASHSQSHSMGLSDLGRLLLIACRAGHLFLRETPSLLPHLSLFQEFFFSWEWAGEKEGVPSAGQSTCTCCLLLLAQPAPGPSASVLPCPRWHSGAGAAVFLFLYWHQAGKNPPRVLGEKEANSPQVLSSSNWPIPSGISYRVHMSFTELHRPLMFWLLQAHALLLTSPSPPGPSSSLRHQTHSLPESLCFCILLLCLEEFSSFRDVFLAPFSLCSMRAFLGMPHQHRPGNLPSCSANMLRIT